MSLVISNKSDGDIESRFYEYGQYLRLGKYVFLSGSFFNLLKNIADYPNARRGEITGISFEKFWYENDDNILIDGELIPVRISDDERVVNIGGYHIDTPDFNKLAAYVIVGGYHGFNDDFHSKMESAVESIKQSSRPMFIELQDVLLSDDFMI